MIITYLNYINHFIFDKEYQLQDNFLNRYTIDLIKI